MISVGFKRVSKKRPCRICRKPSQLGYLSDDMIRSVQSFILIGRTLFVSVAEQR